ncbi:MAG: hypothetical protein ACMXYL_04880 [Candidatus Woesearchaeota archaeon]
MGRVSKDTPLSEITLRKYERPEQFTGRELVRKVCLSVGLLQPGDSRDVIVDILYILVSTRESLTSEDINQMVIELRSEMKLPLVGVAGSNIRRQIKRLRDMHIVEKVVNTYRITEDLSFKEIFDLRIKPFYIEQVSARVKDYFGRVDEEFPDPYKPKK